MKNLLLMGTFLFGVLATQQVFSNDYGIGGGDAGAGCPQDYATGDCVCTFVRYVPQYYNTWREEEEQIPCTRKCTRKVPQYYEVQKCRYVPQYYTETACRYVTECYDVQETKCCKKRVCDRCVRYVPQYYSKRVCGNQPAPQVIDAGVIEQGSSGPSFAAPAISGCATGGCCAR